MFRKTTLLAAAAVVPASACVVVLSMAAQVLPGRDGGGLPPGVGPAGGWGDVQAQIRASDEEWKVIGPKLRKVMMASAAVEAALDESNTGGPGLGPQSRNTAIGDPFMPLGPGGRGGRGGGPRGGPGNDSFSGPGDSGALGRGGPGPGEFGRGGRGPEGFARGGPGPQGFGPDQFGPGQRGSEGRGVTTMVQFGPEGTGKGGRGAVMFRRGGPGPGGPPGLRGGPGGNAVMQKLVELRTALADPNTTTEQFKEKMAAVRNARQKAKAELTAARKDLLKLLTLDQEATLVSLGYLD